MSRQQRSHIDVRHAGQTAEKEEILHMLQTGSAEVLVDNSLQLFQRKKCRTSLLLSKQFLALPGKRIKMKPTIVARYSNNLSETAHIFRQRILSQFPANPQMHFKSIDKLTVQLIEGDVLLLIKCPDNCFQRFVTVVVT